MKKKFSAEIDELIEDTLYQFNKLNQQKNRRWLILIPLVVPMLFPGLGILGIILLAAYFACDSKNSDKQ